jgi:hypothetical protein
MSAAKVLVPRHVLTIGERSAPPTALRAVMTAVHRRHSIHTDLVRRFRRTLDRERALVERLLARRERREHAQLPSRPPWLGPPGANHPTAESMHGPAPVVARGRSAGRPEPTPTPLRGFAPSVGETGAPAKLAAPAIDVQALADQVIRTIDQRVVAARERLGTT